MEELRYTLRYGLSADQVAADVAAFFDELDGDERLQRELRARGIDVDQALRRRQDLKVQTRSSGLTAEAVALIVAFVGPTASLILKDVWTEFILPWLKRKRGRDSIEPRP